jgi:hypothetical protein
MDDYLRVYSSQVLEVNRSGRAGFAGFVARTDLERGGQAFE